MPNNGIQTYGRRKAQSGHSNAVWNSGERRHVFSDSSDTDASTNASLMSNKSQDDSLVCKENIPTKRRDGCSRGKAGRLLRNNVKTVSYKDPLDFTPKYVKPKNTRTALKERDVFELSISSSLNSSEGNKFMSFDKKESNTKMQDKPPKKGKEKKGMENATTDSEILRECGAELAKYSEKFNFSEFDSYSFVISESVSPRFDENQPVSDLSPSDMNPVCFATPQTEPPILNLAKSAMIETSTPNSAQPKSSARLNKSEHSPVTNVLNSFNLKDLDEHSSVMQCQFYLDRLSISQVEHASPQLHVNMSHNNTSVNNSFDMSQEHYQKLQNVTKRLKRKMSNVSVQSHVTVLDSIAESNYDSSCDLFAESEVCETKQPENVENNKKEESLLVHTRVENVSELAHSRIVSVENSSEQGGSFYTAPSHQESSVIFTPRKTRTGRQFGKSLGICTTSKELDEICSSVKDILTPVKNPRTKQIVSPKSKVLHQCRQDDLISFEDYLVEGEWSECTKIGDGVYGEVFRVVSEKESLAIKIIPIEGDLLVNEENQKTFEQILPEIVISRELSDLRYNITNMTSGFVDLRSVRCLQGSYPELLLEQWDIYHARKVSENDRPDFFKDNQLYILFEFADGGRDLESFKFKNMDQAKSVLNQVACSLAIAEQDMMFEHRDLHWGNILVKNTEEPMVSFTVNDEQFDIPSHGVVATIIDFTLSRLTKDGLIVYLDLSNDETLFQGHGDFQFEVYRMMKEVNGNDWQIYCPVTNVHWMAYLTEKLMKEKTYEKTSQPMMRKFRSFHRNIFAFNSVFDIILNSKFFD